MAVFTGDVGAFYAPRRYCVLCDGANEVIRVADAAPLDLILNQSMSWQIMFRMTAPPGAQSLILNKVTVVTEGYRVYMDNAGLIVFETLAGGVPQATVTTVNNYDDGAWHLLQVIRDVPNTRLWIYVDGIADPVGGAAGDNAARINAEPVNIGGDGAGLNTVATYIGETHFWQDKALTAAECLAAWNAGTPPWTEGESDSTAFWHFRENTGVTVRDLTGNGYDATLTNAPTWVSAGIAVAAEAVGALGGTVYALDHPNVDDVIMYVGGVAERSYSVTVNGDVVFEDATGGAVTADYTYYIVSQTGGFHKWELSVEADIYDKTDFRSVSGWREKGAALKTWTASADRHWIHPGFSRETGDKMIVKFFEVEATDRRWEGWALPNSISETVAVDTLIAEGISFEGTDTLSFET